MASVCQYRRVRNHWGRGVLTHLLKGGVHRGGSTSALQEHAVGAVRGLSSEDALLPALAQQGVIKVPPDEDHLGKEGV